MARAESDRGNGIWSCSASLSASSPLSEDLQTMDRLWKGYSNGKFGFTVQRDIWVGCKVRPPSEGTPIDGNQVVHERG